MDVFLVATEPTIIASILEIIPARNWAGAAPDTGGIVNDVTAVIVVIIIFGVILEDVSSPDAFVTLLAECFGTGVVVDAIITGSLYYTFRYVGLSPGNAPQDTRLFALADTPVFYAAADHVATRADIVVVATAGILLDSMSVPYEEEVSALKGDVVLFVLSSTFTALVTLLDLQNLLNPGVGGFTVVTAAVFMT